MSYKDKEKQKEANREAKRRQRQGMTLDKPSTPEGMTSDKGMTKASSLKCMTKVEGMTISKEKAVKLLRICSSLDHDIQGLNGRENMLDLVRMGDLTMREIRGRLVAI